MDNCWTFRVFKDAGVNVIEEWLTSLPPNIEQRFRTLLVRMAKMKRWGRPFFDKLKGYDNLYEIIVKSNVQYRLLGCCGPRRKEFILLIGATKGGASRRKPATWNPRNAREVADMRSKLPLESWRYTDEYH
ncbi:MAG: type II toxin-antitoxin system RelE/ParE family toxin [Desulfobaccales bacterium]